MLKERNQKGIRSDDIELLKKAMPMGRFIVLYVS